MITPLDIENKRFAKQMVNGYSVEEVDDFLDELTIDYSKNYKEVTELRAKVDELNSSLEQYKNIESTLQNTLVMAQTTAEEVKNVAKQKADQIVDEAKANAQKKVDELNNEIVGFINIDIIYEKAEIEYIYVVEKWRKNKIATKLLEKAEKDLINKRVSTITLEVNVNNFSAIKFYEKNEYKKINIRKHYYGNDDAYLMLKELVVE